MGIALGKGWWGGSAPNTPPCISPRYARQDSDETREHQVDLGYDIFSLPVALPFAVYFFYRRLFVLYL